MRSNQRLGVSHVAFQAGAGLAKHIRNDETNIIEHVHTSVVPRVRNYARNSVAL